MTLEEKELLNIKKIIGALETNVNTLQLGNNSPYWNGTNAYQFFKSCGAQIEHDSFLLENLNQCLEYLRDKSNKND